MADRPRSYETNRHPAWELVDMFDDVITSGSIKMLGQNTLVTSAFDYIKLNYTGADITSIVFKTGGAGGTTVATLTLDYSGGNLDSITKS